MRRLFFGLSLLVLAASLSGLAAVRHQRQVQTFGAVDGLPDAALAERPANLRAVNVALETLDDAGLTRAFETWEGFGWLRQTFPWDRIERGPGQFEWEAWDRVVAAARARDKQILAVLAVPEPAAPPDPAGFAAFAAAFALRYRDHIDVYQLWDEPNLYAAWGGPPSAVQYAALLRAAYPAVHAADPTATVLAAALAPTVEAGPDNVSDLLYLQQLYDLGAGPYFDAAAGKPYGFSTGPDDRQADPQLLNFSRFTLLRGVMERNGDGRKLLWGGNFGWNVLASPWGKVTPAEQAAYTLRAYERAGQEWPWAGPLALEVGPAAPSADDQRRGFALADPDGSLTPLGQSLVSHPPLLAAPPGNYPAQHPAAAYTGAWEFSELGADIPEDDAGARLTFTFQGSDLGLRVRRGDYRAYLYVTVDGQPANRLPQDERGAYLVLTAPDLTPALETIPVASGLDPAAVHVAVIEPERGWDQWAIAGFAVGRRLPDGGFTTAVLLLAALSAAGLAGAWSFGRGLDWGRLGDRARSAWARLGDAGQLALTAIVGAGLHLSAWLTFENELSALTRRLGETVPLVVTALTAGLFYWSPSAVVAVLALLALFALFTLRPDLALAFIALFIPFYLFPRLLWERGASVLEFSLWLALGAWLLRAFIRWRTSVSRQPVSTALIQRIFTLRPSSLDLGLLALLAVAALSTLTAARRDVALYEFRTVILGSAIFYFLLRAVPLDDRAVRRIVDFFILGAVAVAAIGLYQYAFDREALITAEAGVARIRSVYGSPNNLALYLGRALPLALALLTSPPTPALPATPPPSPMGRRGRGWGWGMRYALAALIMAAALTLTFSRGALVLGVPAALAVIVIGRWGRRGALAVGAAAVLALAALPALAQVPRFAGLLDTQAGTGFFRVNLWLSAWRMFLDHPLLGVGPDNFLYAYRGFYILPQAWQEPNLSHPHNLALDFLSRLGVLGFAAGAWLVAGFWRQALAAWRAGAPDPAQRALILGLMGLVAHMLAHGLVDHSYFLVDLAFAFSLALALAQRRPAERL